MYLTIEMNLNLYLIYFCICLESVITPIYLCLFVHHEMYFVFYNNEYTVVSVSLIIFYFIMCSILNSEGFVL